MPHDDERSIMYPNIKNCQLNCSQIYLIIVFIFFKNSIQYVQGFLKSHLMAKL